jgi:acyl carrier protein
MEKQEIMPAVQEIFREQLDDESIVLEDKTTAAEVDGWDSLMHLQLIVAIEKRFKIKFTSKEIMSWKNVGEMIDCIEKRNA